jgi:hypothetical protein
LLLGVAKGARHRLFTVLGIALPQDHLMLRVMDLDSNFPLWHGRNSRSVFCIRAHFELIASPSL